MWMSLKHGKRLALRNSLIELSVYRTDRCEIWNDWNFLKSWIKERDGYVANEKQAKHPAALFHAFGSVETDRQTDRLTDRQTHRQADKQTDRQVGTQTQIDRQADRHTYRENEYLV